MRCSSAGFEDTDYMSLRGPAGALYDIVVDPEARGRGVGRALLDATLRELAAQRLFAEAGFRRTMIEMTRESDR